MPIAQARHIQEAQSRDRIAQRRAQIVQLLGDGLHKVVQLSDHLGVHRNTVSEDLKALAKEGFVTKNGKGWEVSQ
jgi:DeoR/GlpR family transcriptional regulator of sugar metabolism